MATGRLPDPNTAPVTAKGDLYTYSTVPAKLAVGSNGDTLVADSSATTGLRWTSGNTIANPVLNSAFQIGQRGTSFSIAASSAATYVLDRWQVGTGANQACTVSRQATTDTTNLPNIQYCLRFQRNSGQTGTTEMPLSQSIESANSIPFAGKTVTLSFYARAGANYSPASSAFKVFLVSGTGTDQNVNGTWTGGVNAIAQTATLTTTWQRFSYSATLNATITQLAPYFSWVPTGTAGANDWFEITGVQIDVGSVALPFRTNGATLAGELAAAMRYYQRLTGDSNQILVNYAFCSNSTLVTGQYQYIVPMRTVPTALDFSNVKFRNHVGSGFAMSSLAFNEASAYAAQIYGTISGGTAEQPGSLLASATTGYIGLSAEL